MIDVVEINEIAALRSYHLAWTALHAETPRASFPQTYEWLESWQRHAGEDMRLRVLIVRASGRPIGIVPLVEQTETGRLGTVRVLTYPRDAADAWCSPIGATQTATLAVAMRHLASTPRTWDVFALPRTAHDTIDRGRTAQAMRLAGLKPTVEPDGVMSAVDFASTGDWGAYLASRPAEVGRKLLRRRVELERRHDLRFIRHRPEPMRCGDGDPRWDLYETSHKIAYQRPNPMLLDHHESASRLGMADLGLLLVDGEPAASSYAYHHHGELTGLRTHCDPALPGAESVLLAWLLEDSFARGDVRLDLGVGETTLQRELRITTESVSQVSCVSPGAWRPRVLRAARRLAGHTGRTA